MYIFLHEEEWAWAAGGEDACLSLTHAFERRW
jgi:hypothetical protein